MWQIKLTILFVIFKNLCKIEIVMITFKNVYKKYTKEFFALFNINLEIKCGEKVALVGPQDSGKTSILRILTGLEKIDKGEVYVKDIPVEKLDYKTDISLGYIPPKANFFDKKTVYDNLKYVLDIRNTSKLAEEETINKAVIDYHLENILQTNIYALTLYQKYLVSIARLSFRKLDVLLVDNIFDDLTPAENKDLIKYLKTLLKDGTTLVVATSDEKIAEALSCQSIVKIKNGVIEK